MSFTVENMIVINNIFIYLISYFPQIRIIESKKLNIFNIFDILYNLLITL